MGLASPLPRPGSSLGQIMLERSYTAAARLQVPGPAPPAPAAAPPTHQSPEGRPRVPGMPQPLPVPDALQQSLDAATTPTRPPAQDLAPEGQMSPQLHAQLLHLASRRAAAPQPSVPSRPGPALHHRVISLLNLGHPGVPDSEPPASQAQGGEAAAADQLHAHVAAGELPAQPRVPPSLQLPGRAPVQRRQPGSSPLKLSGPRAAPDRPRQPAKAAAAPPGKVLITGTLPHTWAHVVGSRQCDNCHQLLAVRHDMPARISTPGAGKVGKHGLTCWAPACSPCTHACAASGSSQYAPVAGPHTAGPHTLRCAASHRLPRRSRKPTCSP